MASISFDIKGYRSILTAARHAGYTIGPFRDALNLPSPGLILRHDIDLSLDLSLEMAKLEAEMGVSATYFIMVTNDYYSPFNRIGRDQLKAIHDLGHEIGLHWDSSNYPEGEAAMAQQFTNELALLGDAIGATITSAAQHIPTDTPLFDAEALAQVYRDRFRYVSDSSMAWREHTPLDLIEQGVDIHFCAHPVWWMSPGADQGEKLRYSLGRRHAEMHGQTEDFIAYIDTFLADRAAFDQAFVEKKGAMNAAQARGR
jgi:hypothetical protein